MRRIPQGSNSAPNSASISMAEPTSHSSPCRRAVWPRYWDAIMIQCRCPRRLVPRTELASETDRFGAARPMRCRRACIAAFDQAMARAGHSRLPATLLSAAIVSANELLAALDEGSVLELPQRLLQFGLAIHHNWTVPGDRLLQRLA